MKQAIIAKVSGLSADSEQDAELLDRIYRTLSSDDIQYKNCTSIYSNNG